MTFIPFHFGWFSNLSFFSCFTFLTSLSSLILDTLFHSLTERLNLPASWNALLLNSSQVLPGTAVERVSAVLREPCQVCFDETPLRPEFVFVVRVRPILILTVQVEGYHIISDKHTDFTNMHVCICMYVYIVWYQVFYLLWITLLQFKVNFQIVRFVGPVFIKKSDLPGSWLLTPPSTRPPF